MSFPATVHKVFCVKETDVCKQCHHVYITIYPKFRLLEVPSNCSFGLSQVLSLILFANSSTKQRATQEYKLNPLIHILHST